LCEDGSGRYKRPDPSSLQNKSLQMHFEPDNIYHVYNRGNNKAPLFFNSGNYLYLLKKIKAEWLTYCDIFCYCLMPNHFHFMLEPRPEGCENIILKGRTTHLQKLSKTIGKTLSSYTQAINIQHKTTGNLFQKKTKAKCLTDEQKGKSVYISRDYLVTCFHYIHCNPLEAKLVKELKDRPYSSWSDYYRFRNGSLCNRQLAMDRLGLTNLDFTPSTKIIYDTKIAELIF
jgi:putative transposase